MSGGLSEQQVHLYTGLFAKHVPNLSRSSSVSGSAEVNTYSYMHSSGESSTPEAHTHSPPIFISSMNASWDIVALTGFLSLRARMCALTEIQIPCLALSAVWGLGRFRDFRGCVAARFGVFQGKTLTLQPCPDCEPGYIHAAVQGWGFHGAAKL